MPSVLLMAAVRNVQIVSSCYSYYVEFEAKITNWIFGICSQALKYYMKIIMLSD